MTRAASPSLEDVIDELFYSSEEMNAELVRDYVKRYPQYEHELLDFSMHWATSRPLDDSCLTKNHISEKCLLSLQSRILNQLYSGGQSSSDKAEVALEVATALANIKGAKALREVSEALALGEQRILLSKILNGNITNIPDLVLNKLAEYLKRPFDVVNLVVNKRKELLLAYKASGKPEIPRKETWEEAIARLHAAPEEKKRLLAMGNRNVAK